MAKIHKDFNDLVSILLLMRNNGKGGGLYLGGEDKVFFWQVGDTVILDSSKIPHGTHTFEGEPQQDRMVGIFIVHWQLLWLCGVRK